MKPAAEGLSEIAVANLAAYLDCAPSAELDQLAEHWAFPGWIRTVRPDRKRRRLLGHFILHHAAPEQLHQA